jgi:hypothetical protein
MRFPISRLNKALLPTFGRPTMATVAGRILAATSMDSVELTTGPFAARTPRTAWRTVSAMKDRIAACFASFLLFLAVAGTAATAGNASGAVYVTTLPAAANVWIDGTYVGRTPVLVDAIASGHHSLTISRTGWVVTEIDVSVPAGGTAMSSTRLVAGPRAFADGPTGSVILRDVPPGAALQLDGAAFKNSPGAPVTLSAGVHHLAFTTAQGRTTRTFTVLPDTPTQLVLHAEHAVAEARSAVVAPADDYIGADAYEISGTKIVVRSNGHVVVAHFGDTSVRYDGAQLALDAAPESIGGKLYLPLALLEKLSDDMSKTP